ncbi:MAG: hypothetical protein GKR90_04320 [Pseudomonadales bacterium]|nr:hypothetical protein [Pseudomonadales bacterium]
MNSRNFLLSIVTIFLTTTATADVPRTASGKPDLSGIWTTATLTPLERPENVSNEKTLSAQEMAEMSESAERTLTARSENPPPGSVGGYNREWLDPGMQALADGRTALIYDPPNGRIPWQPSAKAESDAQRARYGIGPFNSFVDMDTGERCLSDGITMAPLQPYNMNYQIFLTEDWLAINHEMYHEYRLIPLDGRPHIDTKLGQWLGDARGHWEGDTLVVVSQGFADKSADYWAWPWRKARLSLKLTERFTRIDAKTIDYTFTVEDPNMFTQPWSASAPMTTDQASRGVTAGPLYEYACHEGNYALPNVLRGARLAEKRAGQADTGG